MWKKTWKIWAVCMMLLLCISGVTVFASGSDDNSLSDLGIENAVSVSPEFDYSTTEYEVIVPEGTEELQLDPVPSNGAATCDISGQTLTDGKTTVYITVTSESGVQAVYTLDVQAEHPNAAEQIAAANETAAPETEAQKKEQTEAATEAQTETEAVSDAASMVMQQVDKLKSDADFSMKVIYGLIALSVLLLFLVINLLLKNRDLKDDLRDTEEKLDLQTNEFARKERYLATENYYAPVQQQAATGMQQEIPQPVLPPEEAPAVEETFGENKKREPKQQERLSRREKKRQKKEQAEVSAEQQNARAKENVPQKPAPEKKKKKVDVEMIDL